MSLDATLAGLHGERLQQSTERLLQRLYDDLLARVVPLFEAGAEATAPLPLVIVPHGLLHQLPFHALYDGKQYMVERFAISYAPSATAYAVGSRPRRSGPALVLAAPDSRIPAVEQEAQAVAANLRGAVHEVRTPVRPAATRRAVQDAAQECSILHLACHGLFRSDNPLFSALKLSDGWLTGVDVTELDLRGALVSLSACESGRSQVGNGDEVLGLIYAFLSAGAAALVVSQWIVRDDVTATLMSHWYRHLSETDDFAVALRRAQLEILTHYRHPYFWAPFFLVGQRLAR
jgi:CHAT domain-containing protein